MRVFLDTNVLVSAFATRGLSADVLRTVVAEHELLVGEVVLLELRRVLRERIRVPGATITAIEQFLRDQTVVPQPTEPLMLKVRDPDDLWVLTSAVAGQADVLVTWDKDLLSIASRAPLPIVDPRGFWGMVRATGRPKE